MPKKLSLKGLADFITSSPAKQRRILRDYKYSSEDDAHIKIIYYHEARNRIVAYHKSQYASDWLIEEAAHLDSLGTLSENRRRTRLKHNARGLRQYAKYFADKEFEVLKDFKHNIIYGDIYISVRPDLHVIENGTEKLIKLDFSETEPNGKLIRIICQCMFDAAISAGVKLISSSALYFDVPHGKTYHGARTDSPLEADIKATCRDISILWESI